MNDDDDAGANKDYVYRLSSIFPNTDDNPVEYVYSSRDSTGRAVSLETCLKVPKHEEAVINTRDARSGRVIDVQFSLKKHAENLLEEEAASLQMNIMSLPMKIMISP